MVKTWFVIGSLALSLGVVGALDQHDQKEQEDSYCQMVDLNRDHSDQGWPDYRGQYAEMCNK